MMNQELEQRLLLNQDIGHIYNLQTRTMPLTCIQKKERITTNVSMYV